jgi:uncharacterized protein YerC
MSSSDTSQETKTIENTPSFNSTQSVKTFEDRLQDALKLFSEKRSKREIHRMTGIDSRTLNG